MTVAQLQANLTQAICEGYGDYVVWFYDQDGDCVSIDKCYLDDDGDVCLESNEYDNNDYSANELVNILDRYDGDTYIYVYNEDNDVAFDIDEEDEDDYYDDNYDDLWYINDDDELCMDTTYEENE